jgi:selenocysteine-specific elongation factor
MSTRRKNIMLGTAGHVDHGKTALVKLLTGCETDTLAEERQRGLTIDLGFAPCRLADDRVVGVVDVPGHVDFIRNMVAGAQGVDVVIFVVAADDGIMPQTREHLHILTLMGLRHGLVALTKVDLVEPARRDQVAGDLRVMLRGTFLENAPICPLSSLTGEGFETFFGALNGVVNTCGDRPSGGVFRVWCEDAFTVRGQGTVVTGIPASGIVRVGDRLTLLPSGVAGHVRRMQVYGEDAEEGRAGECVALNLPDVDHQDVRRGKVLCGSETLGLVTMAEAEFSTLPSLGGKVGDFVEAQLHVGTAWVRGHVAMLERETMAPGEQQMVQLRLSAPLPLVPGERFVARANWSAQGQSGVTTLGGGRIVGISNARLRRRKPWIIEALRRRRDVVGDSPRWCELMLREAAGPLSMRELLGKSFLRLDELEAIVRQLESAGKAVRLPSGVLVHVAEVERLENALLNQLERLHAAEPRRAGASREELLAGLKSAPELCELALERVLRSGRAQLVGTVYALSGWRPRVSGGDEEMSERIAAAFEKAGCAGPSVAELSSATGLVPARIEEGLRGLIERGVVVRLDAKTLVHRKAVEQAIRVVLDLFGARSSFTTMEFRDALNVSRKYAVPLLDHLDKIRFTVRTGHDRTPGVEARKRLK